MGVVEVEAKQDARCSIKKTLRCSIRTSWRCAYEHWAIFSLVLLLYLLHKYTPGFFAFLLSTSPVIICTSLLLAVLLCHGSAHLPEIHEDRKAPGQISAGSSSRDVCAEEQQRFSGPTLKKNISTEASFRRRDCNNHPDLGENVPLLKQVCQGDGRLEKFHTSVPYLKQEAATEEYMKYNAEKESKGAFPSKDEYASSFDDVHSSEDVKVVAKPDDQGTVSTDAQSGEVADISPDHKAVDGTPSKCKWGRAFSVRRRKKLADIKVEAINSVVDNQLDHSLFSPFDTFGSHDNSSSGFDHDTAERHSPDVSMTDNSQVLDETETGPPLGVDCSCPDPITTDDSDNHLNIYSLDSQPQSVNSEVADNSKARDDGEEKKDDAGTEPALLWTADNEKNVMDLGYSEIERNRRLETLMVKRKSRKNIQFDPDSLGGISVSARRMNPFADDAEIPGSAPPILHPRDNDPFDFLTDEQSDDSGLPAPDNLEPQKDPMPVLHQDALFRRHESFSFGRPPQSQRHGLSRFKPCFAPEESSLDEASTSSFQRQFSDRSVSRLSVVSECDTVSSVGDQEHNDLIRNYIRGVRESSPSLLGQQDGGGDGDAVSVCAGNECSDGISSFVDNETLNAVIC
ncbi:hypothetical protein BDA96_09G189500 [Sorghum bicolor]|jgi:hypothetical protein|uniref:Uncharacterized protein n=2 Tax=Sorghum bicolor TaxID=4558 RepID=A0A921QB77_SORBI|nr:uncharacterized protein LOC8064163 [Sorghum bicolor]EES19722.1 hypothetical protein SORBI_3009G179400 [Sorghum bicolor]KAG0518598.1 hypothetical protein BDA96_09G189500 [Sorghum bicolor]|eukprot:XP_002441292.1 uncharacterized protein LOC8064163 [Sorghum bicolor]